MRVQSRAIRGAGANTSAQTKKAKRAHPIEVKRIASRQALGTSSRRLMAAA